MAIPCRTWPAPDPLRGAAQADGAWPSAGYTRFMTVPILVFADGVPALGAALRSTSTTSTRLRRRRDPNGLGHSPGRPREPLVQPAVAVTAERAENVPGDTLTDHLAHAVAGNPNRHVPKVNSVYSSPPIGARRGLIGPLGTPPPSRPRAVCRVCIAQAPGSPRESRSTPTCR